jgi:hypothetical protein
MANQVQKLAYVDSKLGVSLPGQQTTRVIYDSVNAVAGQQFFEFFTNFAGKNEFQTNLTTNKLDSAESMVIKSIQIIMNTATSNLIDHLNLNITVGNQVVLKDLTRLLMLQTVDLLLTAFTVDSIALPTLNFDF